MLPTIKIGNLEILDARSLCEPNEFAPVSVHDKLYCVIHHTAVARHLEVSGSNAISEIARVHTSQGYGGFGYHAAVHASGKVYQCRDWNTTAAGAAQTPFPNKHGYHIVLLGDFTLKQPTSEMLTGARELCANLSLAIGRKLIILPHAAFNVGTDSWRSQWNTACPGNTWPSWIGNLMY